MCTVLKLVCTSTQLLILTYRHCKLFIVTIEEAKYASVLRATLSRDLLFIITQYVSKFKYTQVSRGSICCSICCQHHILITAVLCYKDSMTLIQGRSLFHQNNTVVYIFSCT
jgi:hypothetical protein